MGPRVVEVLVIGNAVLGRAYCKFLRVIFRIMKAKNKAAAKINAAK